MRTIQEARAPTTVGRVVADPGRSRAMPGALRRLGPAELVPIALIMLVGVRLFDFLPILAPLRPALVLSLGGGAYLWSVVPRAQRTALLHNPLFRGFLAYLAWAALTVPFALWPGRGAQTMRVLVTVTIVVGATLVLTGSRPALHRAVAAFVLAGCIYGVLLLSQGESIGMNRLAVGATLDSNDAAAVFAICVPLALGLARVAGVGRKMWWVGAAGLLMFSVVGTGSRGGTLALVVGLIVFTLGLRGLSRYGYLVLLLATGVAAWQWGPQDYRDRMTSLVRGEQDYNQTSYFGREQTRKRGWGYWRANPILGVGVGNFAVAEGAHLDELGRTGKWGDAHNTFVQAFADLGTPGGLILVCLILGAGRSVLPLWKSRSRQLGTEHRPEFLAALFAACVGGYFLSHAYAYHLAITIALAGLAGQTLGIRAPETLLRRSAAQRPRQGRTRPGSFATRT